MMRPRLYSPAAVAVLCTIAGSVFAQPELHRIAKGGDPFPGRPGSFYVSNPGLTFLGPRSIDREGNVYFLAGYTNGAADDLLVYRPASGLVETFVRDDFELRGFSTDVFWGVVGGPVPGMMAHVPLAHDPDLGPRLAAVVSRSGGSHEVMGMELDQPPGYDEPAAWFDVGESGGAALDLGMNRLGAVTFGGAYIDQQNVQHYGLYLTLPGGQPARIIDSRLPVPGHPAASWVPYDGWLSPFEPGGAGIDDAGKTYFRAKYQDADGKRYKAFYTRTADGTITPIADGGTDGAIPGRPPGWRYTDFPEAMNNRVGDAGFSGSMNDPNGLHWGTGVYISRSGGPFEKLVDSSDPVPGVPDAVVFHQPFLRAMSDSGYVVVANNHGLHFDFGNAFAYSLTLYDPDGGVELVLRFDELPGLPGLRATFLSEIEVNELGDVMFTAKLSTPGEQYATYVYLNGTNTLVPVLRTGGTLDGMTVLEYDTGVPTFDPSGASGVTGGARAWDDRRTMTIRALLQDGNKQVAALYTVRTTPVCAPDLDGNGALDLFDFLTFLNLFNGDDPGADFNGDGLLDLFDFLAFVNAFNQGC